MKQNLLSAKIVVLVVVLVPGGLVGGNSACARRPRHSSFENRSKQPAPAAVSRKININTASASELEKLPGVGEVLAERIVSHRQQHGPFRRAEHVMMVRGISERKFLGFQPMIKTE